MFLPFYSLPRITMRMALKEDIPITSSYDMQLLNESHAESLSSLHEPTYPNLDILYNPIHLFLFLTFYSIWFGGFTRLQVYEYLTRNKIEDDLK